MNIYIKHPTNPLIAIDVNIKDSSEQMTIGALLKALGSFFFVKDDSKNFDVSRFWRLRDEKTHEYLDDNLPVGQLSANDEFTIAFGTKADRDLDGINANAAELNQEAEDVLAYQELK
ncbi:MAG: hypothetical protein EPN21_10480 [Methylococcaceae bacterium]|nr:MAG: hypothetical protein EPN21_10480 [Methylococcaceae bacterium]